MPKEYSRSERVADAIQKELASVIRGQVRDPRVSMVSVNAVHTSPDLSSAKVFVTFVDNPQNLSTEKRVALLNKASSFLRTQLARELTMRFVPQLKFVFDETIYRALEISDLIDRAVQQDEEKRSGQSD